MEEALHDIEAFVMRRGLVRATSVRRRNASASTQPHDLEEVAPANPAAVAASAGEEESAV